MTKDSKPQWRDDTKAAPLPKPKAPTPPRDPETGAFREG